MLTLDWIACRLHMYDPLVYTNRYVDILRAVNDTWYVFSPLSSLPHPDLRVLRRGLRILGVALVSLGDMPDERYARHRGLL